MTSVCSSYSQIGSKIKYLLTTSDTTNFYCPKDPFMKIPSIMTEAEFVNAFDEPNPPYASGELLRDMGKTIVVLGENQLEVAKYTQVQSVDGFKTEGVPDDYNNLTFGKRFVRVWHADPNPLNPSTKVAVARIG
jgi:hypothetical protein